jgi:hypothetical protein
MSLKLRTKRPDKVLAKIVGALKEYEKAHPQAQIEAYRQNNVSVRIRIIGEEFEGKGRAEREEELWNLLAKIPEEYAAEVSMVLLLTPEEAKKSIAYDVFEYPLPSRI